MMRVAVGGSMLPPSCAFGVGSRTGPKKKTEAPVLSPNVFMSSRPELVQQRQ